MRYTNKHGLPESLVRAVTNDPYTKGDADYSATELLRPPQINRLTHEHADKLTEDVSDVVYRLLGSGIHTVLERAYTPEEGETERRFFATLDGTLDGKVISGAMDLHETGRITDYKVTATYTVMRGDHNSWEQQLNIYDWLARMNGVEIHELEIVAILRDWKKSQRFKTNYPEAGVVTIPIVKWTPEEQEAFIRERIREQEAEVVRPCTKEETWNGIRCKDWCAVAPFCPQAKGG